MKILLTADLHIHAHKGSANVLENDKKNLIYEMNEWNKNSDFKKEKVLIAHELEKKENLFKPLLENGLINVDDHTPAYKKLRKLFDSMKDEAEASDFDADPLELEAQFNILIPWFIPIDVIRDYYGEKIAIYFDFL